MPLYAGDVSEYTAHHVDLRLTLTRGTGPAYALTVSIGAASAATGEFVIPVRPWEVDAVTSRYVIKLGASATRDPGDPARDIGGRLFEALFTGASASVYAEAVERAKRQESGLSLRIVTDDPVLLSLPWELLYDRNLRQDFLALAAGGSVVRELPTPALRLGPAAKVPPLKVLLLTADPAGRLETDRDIRVFKGLGNRVQLRVVRDVTRERLLKALAAEPVDIIHFAGAGVTESAGRQRLVLLGDRPAESSGVVSAEEVLGALERQPHARLVVFNAYRTDAFAAEIARVVPVVIGVRGDMNALAGALFAEGFYGTLLQGAPVAGAVANGRAQVDFAQPGFLDWAGPVAFVQVSGALVARTAEAPAAEGQPSEGRHGKPPGALPPQARLHDPRAREEAEFLRQQIAMDTENLAAVEAQWGRVIEKLPDIVREQQADLTARITAARRRLAELESR
jgi:hypothetical protein